MGRANEVSSEPLAALKFFGCAEVRTTAKHPLKQNWKSLDIVMFNCCYRGGPNPGVPGVMEPEAGSADGVVCVGLGLLPPPPEAAKAAAALTALASEYRRRARKGTPHGGAE